MAMHGFFLYTVFSFSFSPSLRVRGERNRPLYLPFSPFLSILHPGPPSTSSLYRSPPSLLLVPLRVAIFSPAKCCISLHRFYTPHPSSIFFFVSPSIQFRCLRSSLYPALSSALLFPASVGKPSWSFCSMLARAAGRHIIFSVFLLRGNLSSGEPVEVEVAEAAKVEYYRHS